MTHNFEFELDLRGLCGPETDPTDFECVTVKMDIETSSCDGDMDWEITEIQFEHPATRETIVLWDNKHPTFKIIRQALTASQHDYIYEKCSDDFTWESDETGSWVTGRAF